MLRLTSCGPDPESRDIEDPDFIRVRLANPVLCIHIKKQDNEDVEIFIPRAVISVDIGLDEKRVDFNG